MNVRFLLPLIVIMLVLVPHGVFGATTTAPTTNAEGCKVIDDNWKDYGESHRGANTKITNVVKNACAAIGEHLCRLGSGLRTGANEAQHKLGTAIDVSVAGSAKQKEFLVLAICGLRRVNNCQGGVGYYLSGSIHIDVRQGKRDIWSSNRRSSSVPYLDSQGQSILYGFAQGNCTGGTFVGDYTETERYGPVQQSVPQILNQQNQATPQSLQQALAQPQQQSTSGGGEVLGTQQAFQNQPPLLLDEDDNRTSDDSGKFPDEDSEENTTNTESINNDTEKQECKSLDLFGVTLFNTCNEQGGTGNSLGAGGSVESEVAVERHLVGRLAGDVPRVAIDGYEYNDAIAGVPLPTGSNNIFYGIHDPTDDGGRSYGTFSQNNNVVRAAARFVSGQAQDITSGNSYAAPGSVPPSVVAYGGVSYRTFRANIPFTAPGGFTTLLLPFIGLPLGIGNSFSI